MRLAIISDVHGNLPALEAVHAEIRRSAPDFIVNLGDCVSGPLWPKETAQYLIAENWPTVTGNHDRIVAGTQAAEMEAVDRFAYEALSEAQLAWVSALPACLTLEDDILLCHGAPSSDETFLLEEDGGDHFFPSNERQIRTKLGDVDARLVLCGHTHTPRVACLSDRTIIVNPGSVGIQAFPGLTATGSPHARYAIATFAAGDWSFTQHALQYNSADASRRAAETGFARWSHGLLTGYASKFA